ncbi:MAG TPA: 4-deoxy-4-formamido-L-arabinose-phosphoundecaprenol deformylase [Sedimentisphaerales bacterium]|nr:4-deoxy-4-formamido-L-arabinose-phosphoundecaprenol deformylase [Sedimentisphaerales bacterium]
MKIGLRIDVDTFRGTRIGVPNLCEVLARHDIKATFFFSVGPDNMGRHLWRLLRPAFLWKMLRTRAASLYGWDILLRGTFWPGPVIGKRLAGVIRDTAAAGHEVGLHAWDHHAWQVHIDKMDGRAICQSLDWGAEMLSEILGHPPICSAVPGWKCNDTVLEEKARFVFRYNSDCRGKSIFRPVVHGRELAQPQIPVTLPTYDEVIGRNGVSNDNYNEYLLGLLDPDRLNVLTIHAEVEGIVCGGMFERFVEIALSQGHRFLPLGNLMQDCPLIETARIEAATIPGREGWVACQTPLPHGGKPVHVESPRIGEDTTSRRSLRKN